MNFLDIILLGLIQGLTEFLPISSSGHLLIFEEILGMDKSGSLMEIILHGGTLISIIVYFSFVQIKQQVYPII